MSRVVTISTDPIADMLTRIRNAIAVNASQVRLPHSQVKETIARILADNGFLQAVKVEEEAGSKSLIIEINAENESARITEIARMSRPGRRMYVKSDAVPMVKRGRGLIVISTSSGMMSGSDAKAKKLGGELICKVY